MRWADIYGGSGPGRSEGESSPTVAEEMSGDFPSSANRPAYMVIVTVALLVAIRLLWEYSG